MFAIIQAGGRQVKVNPGSVVTIDRVEAEAGKEITFDQVLFLSKDGGEMLAGAPFVANAKVVGVVDGESRGPKIRVFNPRTEEHGWSSPHTVIEMVNDDMPLLVDSITMEIIGLLCALACLRSLPARRSRSRMRK